MYCMYRIQEHKVNKRQKRLEDYYCFQERAHGNYTRGENYMMEQNLNEVLSLIEVLILGISAILVYRQIRVGVMAQELNAMIKVDDLFSKINQLAKDIYAEFPIEILMEERQFPKKPPYRFKRTMYNNYELGKMECSEIQKDALNSLTKKQYAKAKKVIELLNDVGQYIEDGFIDKKYVLGKYHATIIRLCSVVEVVRRDIERKNRSLIGGYYGQRILRLRHKSIMYVKIHEKHREGGIKIDMGKTNTSILLVKPIENTLFNRIKGIMWYIEYIKKYQ